MRLAICGGWIKSKHFYTKNGQDIGFSETKVFSRSVPNIGQRIKNFDAILICTGHAKHTFVQTVLQTAQEYLIPYLRTHSSGVLALKKKQEKIYEEVLINKNLKGDKSEETLFPSETRLQRCRNRGSL